MGTIVGKKLDERRYRKKKGRPSPDTVEVLNNVQELSIETSVQPILEIVNVASSHRSHSQLC